jgi:hypothetical protein
VLLIRANDGLFQRFAQRRVFGNDADIVSGSSRNSEAVACASF